MSVGTVRVHPDRPVGRVSPLIYGHFTEHLVNIVYDGLWSEKLFGRKFEAPMTKRLTHEVAAGWRPFSQAADEWTTYPRGSTPLPRYASPQRQAHHAQAVVVQPGQDGVERGLVQDDVVVDADTVYHFRGSVRRVGGTGTLRVALRAADGAVLGEATVQVPPITQTRFGPRPSWNHLWMDDQSWHEVETSISASRADARGSLTLTFDPDRGELCAWWLDWVSLMPAGNIEGWHAKVVDELRALPARLLKWPGGCMADSYDWRYGIGPRDRRYGSVDQAWAAWDENDVGTDEFIELCRLTGAEPVLGVNAGNGTPELAAAWVEYCNGPATSDWGKVRAQHGHPQPHGVRYWTIGNEQWGCFERGFDGPQGYADRYLAIAEAMRKVDPSIVLAAVGQPGAFDRVVLERCAPHIDLLQIHFYTPEPDDEVVDLASASRKVRSASSFDDLFRSVAEDLASVEGAEHIRVCLDEWGWARAGHAGAMFVAAVFNAMHRAAPLVALAARSTVMNVDGVLERNGETVGRTPVYDVFRLYAQGHLPEAVVADASDPSIDVACLRDPATDRFTIFLVNTAPDAAEVEISGIDAGRTSTLHRLLAGPDGPDGASALATEGGSMRLDLPPVSLAVIEIA